MKLYYKVTEVAERLNVSNSKVRYWSDYFGLTPKRSRNNSRRFVEEEIKKLEFVKYQTEKEGRKLDKVKEMM